MTKLLVICTCTPDVVSSHQHGSSIWSFVLLNGLLEVAEVTLFTPGFPQGQLHNSELLHVQETRPSSNMGRMQRAWRSIRRGFLPVMFESESDTVIRSLQKLKSGDFDVCILLDDYAAIYFEHLPPEMPTVLFRHNIFSYTVNAKSAELTHRDAIVGVYHHWLALRFDRWTSLRSHVLVAQSEEMLSQLRTFTTNTPIVLIPVMSRRSASKQNRASSSLPIPETRLVALFIGNFLASANVDAAAWFVDDILPRLDESIRARYLFRFVGQAPPAEIRQRVSQDASVEFAGYVEDLEQELNNADVGFIPLRVGSGVKVKSLTMFGAGLPTVTTSVGVEGIAVSDGIHCLIADTAEQFACGLQKIAEPKVQQSLSAAVLELMALRESQQQLSQTLNKAIDLAQATGSKKL